ncbi:MAG: TIGR02677 family protein [Solirubrobacteraceae bacterium]
MTVPPPEPDPQRFKPFAYLGAPNAALYRQVMLAFVAAKRRFVVHLRGEEVAEALAKNGPTDEKAIVDALGQLVEWGNLRADPDTSRVTGVEDFYRARFLYQLTHAGEAAERSLAVFDEQLGRRGALQAVALEDIATGLRAIRELTQLAEPDVGRAALLLRDLVQRCADLADNAQAFMGSLQRTIDLYELDTDAFRAYKDRLIEYLERFIRDLTAIGAEIAELLDKLDPAGVERLLALVARRDADDVAPGVGETVSDEDFRAQAFDAKLASWRERWLGLRQWFLSDTGHPCQAKLLRIRARKAIPDLLAVVAMLNERRAGRSDRTADFRELAAWFAQAPDDAAMHQLWQATFGLRSTRHLTLDADTEQARAQNPIPASTPWAQAPPLMISPRLRRTGSYERRGKPNRVIDRRQERRLLAERAAAEAEQTAAARDRLVTEHPIRLSDLDHLDAEAFSLFLALLGEALSAQRPDERGTRTTTGDGSLEIRLTPISGATAVEIRTDAGVFRGLDHVLQIVDLTASARRLVA